MSAEREVKVVRPGEGRRVAVVGDVYRYLATGEDTGGAYALWEASVPPGGGPPPHLHTRECEGFYVLEGEVTFRAGGRAIRAGPGTFVHSPAHVVHAFRNESDRPARMLIFVAPGGLERMFLQTGTVLTDPAQPAPPIRDAEVQRLLAAAPSFGIEFKGP